MSSALNRKSCAEPYLEGRPALIASIRLVDEITYKQAAASASFATPSAILGPFWRADAPERRNGETVCLKPPADGQHAYMHGTITDASTAAPLSGVVVDIWQASTNGTYPGSPIECR